MFNWRDFPIEKGATYRGGGGSRLHMIENLSRAEAKHFLLHDRYGRQLQRDFPNVSFDDLAGYVCEASQRPTEKREVSTMDKHLAVILKSETAMAAFCKQIAANGGGGGFSHPEFDDMLARYAKNQHPALHVGTAIVKVLAEETPIAKAYQAVHSTSYPAVAKPAAGDAPVVGDEDEEDEDERDGDGSDALAELEQLAESERRRDPQLTKAQSFTKVFTDPSNAKLAQRERRQSLAKLMLR